jgi:membrane-associated phospholipid phosphatase
MSPSELTTTASLAGAYALSWYLGLLALLLGSELVSWSARPRLPLGVEPGPAWPPRAQILLGTALIVGAGVCFAAIAHAIAANGSFVQADLAFLNALRANTPSGVVRVFEWATWLGDGRTIALLCTVTVVVLLARRERGLAYAMVAAVGGNGLLNAALKRVFQRVRPPHEAGLPLAHGWSFPSGHASGAVVAYGMLAYLLVRALPARWHLPAVMAATALAFSIGWSRIFVEAHFASDVLAAFASGLAWLVFVVMVTESWLRGWRPSHGFA